MRKYYFYVTSKSNPYKKCISAALWYCTYTQYCRSVLLRPQRVMTQLLACGLHRANTPWWPKVPKTNITGCWFVAHYNLISRWLLRYWQRVNFTGLLIQLSLFSKNTQNLVEFLEKKPNTPRKSNPPWLKLFMKYTKSNNGCFLNASLSIKVSFKMNFLWV